MKTFKIKDMTRGWFVGQFSPTAHNAPFEVGYLKHHKGQFWSPHYHKESTEINLLVKGKMKVNGQEINEGDIFVIDPFEIAEPEFLEDCELVVVKTSSNPEDKYYDF